MAGEIAEIGYSVPEDVEAAVDEAEQMVFDVAERRTADTMRPLHDLLAPGSTGSRSWPSGARTSPGVATGYHDLDRILPGLQPSTLTIVGARPAMGKTSFALGILAHVGSSCAGRRSCSPWIKPPPMPAPIIATSHSRCSCCCEFDGDKPNLSGPKHNVVRFKRVYREDR